MSPRLPIIFPAYNFIDVWNAIKKHSERTSKKRFLDELAHFLKVEDLLLTNSGSSALIIILNWIKENTSKRKVILPAYTAGNLISCIRQAGLVPVLCDISLEDFNFDRDICLGLIDKDTAVVLAVHMFGIGIYDLGEFLKKIPPDVITIEDCAQSMGTSVRNIMTGRFAELSFFSFGRGKNFPLFQGGCILSQKEKTLSGLKKIYSRITKKNNNLLNFILKTKITLFSCLSYPNIYELAKPLVVLFRDRKPKDYIEVLEFDSFQSELALRLLDKVDEWFKKRFENGIYLHNALNRLSDLLLPKLHPDVFTVFNRFPIVIKDVKKRKKIETNLNKAGIEFSSLYHRPLHHIFNLGYRENEFPRACFLAKNLITLPVHPQVEKKHLEKTIEVFYGTFKKYS